MYQNGHERPFTILYQRYSGKVYSYLKSRVFEQEALDDAIQNVFVKLHRSRSQFNSSFTFAPWLFTIARTVAMDAQKVTARQSRYSNRTDVDLDQLSSPQKEEPDLSEVDLSGLPKPHRTALEMRYLQEKSFEEIAKHLETTPGNVRQIVSRSLKQLKIMLIKEGSS